MEPRRNAPSPLLSLAVAAIALALLIALLSALLGEPTRPLEPALGHARPRSAERGPDRIEPLPPAAVARRIAVVRIEPEPGVDPAGRGRLVVTVVDEASGEPLPDAWVAAVVSTVPLVEASSMDEVLPDAAFEVRGWHGNPVTIETFGSVVPLVAGAEGRTTAAMQARVVPGAGEGAVTLALGRGGAIEVVARSAVDGQPIDGVAMAAQLDGRAPELVALFDAFTERIVVRSPDETGAEAASDRDDRTPVFPSLPPPPSERRDDVRSVRTLDEAVARLQEGEDAALWREGGEQIRRRHLDLRDGRGRFDALPPGDQWGVVFWPLGRWQHGGREHVTVTEGATTTLTFELEPVNVVAGHVRFDDGAPAEGAVVHAFTESSPVRCDSAAVEMAIGRDGAFALPVNRWRFLLLAQFDHGRDERPGVGYGAWSVVQFQGLSGEQREIELVLAHRERDETGALDVMRGVVRQPDGAPAAGAAIHAGVYGPRCRCDETGRFTLFGGFGALAFAVAEVEREEEWLDREFELVATHDEERPEGRRTLHATRPFTVRELREGREIELRLGEPPR